MFLHHLAEVSFRGKFWKFLGPVLDRCVCDAVFLCCLTTADPQNEVGHYSGYLLLRICHSLSVFVIGDTNVRGNNVSISS